ncbi:DUF1624 domain-containing protein [Lysobacter sp. CA199]|uniref:DUF1624 domain-containing protein n=1 Tax=Lysobacter sp. CA199 TaxID=3455608 RepID=UPI003F8D3B39
MSTSPYPPASSAPSSPARPSPDPRASALTRGGAPRLDMIDALRGLVIALMVLDHVRGYFHGPSFAFNPTDLDKTTPLVFATRWITHLCAPSFVFLAGVSIFLQGANGRSRAQVARLALSRGAWLVLLELTVVVFGFHFRWPFLFLQVIWAIGMGMIAMAALVWLPRIAVLALGVAIVASHGLFDHIDSKALGAFAPLWTLAMQRGVVPGIDGFVAYPALPWVGILLIGYGLGPLFALDPAARRRAIAALAVAMLTAFALLRGAIGWGDPSPWRRMDDPLLDAMSFINVTKYSPSPAYVLITLGISLSVMLLLERALRGGDRRRDEGGGGAIARCADGVLGALLAYGRTPLFTYLLHIYLVHGLALLIGTMFGVPASDFIGFVGNGKALLDAGWGLGLAWVYALWLLVLVALYPLSRAFAAFKRRRRDWWLSYL